MSARPVKRIHLPPGTDVGINRPGPVPARRPTPPPVVPDFPDVGREGGIDFNDATDVHLRQLAETPTTERRKPARRINRPARAPDMPPDAKLIGDQRLAQLPKIFLPHMDEYLEELENSLRAANTIQATQVGLRRLAVFCDMQGIKHPDEITRRDLLRYHARMHELGLAASYRHRLMGYARAWLTWLHDLGYIEENPYKRIRIPSVRKRPNPLTHEQIAAIFQAHRESVFTTNAFHYHQRETALVLLYGWGLRLHEAVSLSIEQMNPSHQFVTVVNKGHLGSNTTKQLPYPDVMKQVIQRYLPHRARTAKPGVTQLLVSGTGNAMTGGSLYQIVVAMGRRAGVDTHPHQLRDTAGTHMLEKLPLEKVMRILGHTDTGTTLSYARVNDNQLKDAHAKALEELLLRSNFTSDLLRPSAEENR